MKKNKNQFEFRLTRKDVNKMQKEIYSEMLWGEDQKKHIDFRKWGIFALITFLSGFFSLKLYHEDLLLNTILTVLLYWGCFLLNDLTSNIKNRENKMYNRYLDVVLKYSNGNIDYKTFSIMDVDDPLANYDNSFHINKVYLSEPIENIELIEIKDKKMKIGSFSECLILTEKPFNEIVEFIKKPRYFKDINMTLDVLVSKNKFLLYITKWIDHELPVIKMEKGFDYKERY